MVGRFKQQVYVRIQELCGQFSVSLFIPALYFLTKLSVVFAIMLTYPERWAHVCFFIV